MEDSIYAYKTAIEIQSYNIQQMNQYEKLVKDAYLQVITTVFYELITKKTSPLLSEMYYCNKINLRVPQVKNFQFENLTTRPLGYAKNSYDMYFILKGLCAAFSENIGTCVKWYEQCKSDIFQGKWLDYKYSSQLSVLLQDLDEELERFLPKEKIVEVQVEKIIEKKVETQSVFDEETKSLMQDLDSIAKNRISDDEKIINAITTVQKSMQNEVATIQDSLKKILEIRDGIDFRTLEEPISQLINLYEKIDRNLKRHPMDNTEKGYKELLGRCNSFLNYVIQSLEMLGVEIIRESGGTFDPDRNKIADNAEPVSLDSVVSKVNKFGFAYKGKIIEKAEVEVAKKSQSFVSFFHGGKNK